MVVSSLSTFLLFFISVFLFSFFASSEERIDRKEIGMGNVKTIDSEEKRKIERERRRRRKTTTTNNNHVNNFIFMCMCSNFNQIDFDMHILPCYPSNKLTDKNLTFEGERTSE
jgi:hypothetical protein